MTPEEKARPEIEPQLTACDWVVEFSFLCESNSVEPLFRDERDPSTRCRRVLTYRRPDPPAEWSLQFDILLQRLAQMQFTQSP